MRFPVLVLLLLGNFGVLAQSIRGTVTDAATGQPLPFANVYVNNSTIGSTTNEKGEFTIKNTPLGSIELIASFVGYETNKRILVVGANNQFNLEIKLKQSEQFLKEMEVVAGKNKSWDAMYAKFEKAFLGETGNAKYCKIVNPWVIDVEETGSAISAVASEPIEVENRALGYQIAFDLKEFSLTDTTFRILGYSFYTELEPGKKSDLRRWSRVREQTYERSLQYLFLSMINNDAKKNGYELYKLLPSAAHLARNEWFNDEELGSRVVVLDESELNARQVEGNVLLELPSMTEIHFNRISTANQVYRDVPFEVSWIVPNKKWVEVKSNGTLLDPNSISVYGYLSTLRVADLMPIDYRR